MNSFIKKLSIGTAQFGLSYGVANNLGKIELSEASKILYLASDNGLESLDTAIAYGDSEEILGKIGVSGWRITTKLPCISEDCVDIDGWVKSSIEHSLRNLNVTHLHSVLLHHPQDIFGPCGIELVKSLETIKSQKMIGKIGISIYDPSELRDLFELYSFDVVQAPLNILDQRLVNSGWLGALKKMGVEVQVRSAFLQGLLLMPASLRPDKFSIWNEVWNTWDRWLLDSNIRPLEACLGYVNSIVGVDKIVIGVDGVKHLSEILGVDTGLLFKLPDWPKLADTRIINPATWGQI